MTKEKYIQLRKKGMINEILHIYFLNKTTGDKILSFEAFLITFKMYIQSELEEARRKGYEVSFREVYNNIIESVLQEYDTKFECVYIMKVFPTGEQTILDIN